MGTGRSPRFSTILSYTDFIDWKSFIYDKLMDDMASRYQAIRKGDPTHLITAHAVGASLSSRPMWAPALPMIS